MNSNAVILGSFVGSCAIITWREFKNPDPSWPIPIPPPYRYIGAGVAFGLLALVADTLSDRIASVIAVGLLIGLAFQTAQSKAKHTLGTFTPTPKPV